MYYNKYQSQIAICEMYSIGVKISTNMQRGTINACVKKTIFQTRADAPWEINRIHPSIGVSIMRVEYFKLILVLLLLILSNMFCKTNKFITRPYFN